MEILDNIAKQFLKDVNADGKVDLADAVSSLQTLLADASGKIDFNAMIAKLKSLDLSEAVSSWLGDGENSVISKEKISELFDSEKLSKFAESLNIELDAAKEGLSNAIPKLMDQISSGGELMDKFNEGIAILKEGASDLAEAANASAEGFFAKLKKLFS